MAERFLVGEEMSQTVTLVSIGLQVRRGGGETFASVKFARASATGQPPIYIISRTR